MSDNDNSNQGDEGLEPKRARLTRSAVAGKKTLTDPPSTGGGENEEEEKEEEGKEEQMEQEEEKQPPTTSQQDRKQEEQRLTRALGQISITLPYSGSYSTTTIRVGRDYQAEIPQCSSPKLRELQAIPERSLCLWNPVDCGGLGETELEEFCEVARVQYGYTMEQSLGMLHFHKYDIQGALSDLSNFFPQKDEWSTEDKVLFEQAFSFHGKNFTRIKQLLPQKSMANLVEYYYAWKKTRNYTSYMDNQGEQADSSDSDEEDDDRMSMKKEEKKKTCHNCRQHTTTINTTTEGNLCNACHLYWRKSGGMRPCKKKLPSEHPDSPDRRKGQSCPKGFDLNVDQLRQFAWKNPEWVRAEREGRERKEGEEHTQPQSSGQKVGNKQYPPPTAGEAYLKQLDFRIFGLKSKAVKNSKYIESFARESGIHREAGGIHRYRLPKMAKPRVTNKWTDRDKMIAVQGFRRYGKSFPAIAEVIQTKSAESIKAFFRDNRDRYGLDTLVSEWEAEREGMKREKEDEKNWKKEECIDLLDEQSADDNTQTLD